MLDCSKQLTREHYFSKAILERIDASIHVRGMPWQPDGETILLPPEALAAKILCARHNSALSPLDAMADDTFGLLRRFDVELGDHAPEATSETVRVNGPDLERWLLKCLLGLATLKRRDVYGHARCVRILFGEEDWPQEWGLCLEYTSGKAQAFNGLGAELLLGPGNVVRCCRVSVAGTGFLIGLGETPERVLYRPFGARFAHSERDAVKTVDLLWSGPPFADYMGYERAGSYTGAPVPFI